MKSASWVLLLIASLNSAALAQVVTADKVPVPVKQALGAKFQNVKSVEWKISGDKNFEAEFTLKGVAITIKFDPAGKWLETETQIPSSDVPKAVLGVLAQKFRTYKIVETQNLQLHNDPQMIFEIHLDNGKEILKVLLHADGAILSQSVKPKKQNPSLAFPA
ncbi:MAG: PepSY-like domain-containing protein [Acidobacteriia bacterium]|nr:PepSY-like domain-containing protein [Terriglobia bacterium]